MGSHEMLSLSALEATWDTLLHSRWATFVLILLLPCIITRIITGFQSRSVGTPSEQPRSVRMVPYWVPWLGHSFSFGRDHVHFLEKSRDYMNEPVFAISLGGIKHNVITSASMTKSVLWFRGTTSAPLIDYALKMVFGDRGPIQNLSATDHHVFHHNLPNLFVNEPFLTEASTALARYVQQETPNLVTFSRSPVDQASWERGSEATVIEGTASPVCEVNFFALIRNFVGQLTTSTVMGRTLLEVSPGILDDLWSLDDRFTALSMGVPRFLSPGVSAAIASRERLLRVLAKIHERFLISEEGGDPGMEFRDLEDISGPIRKRILMSQSLGLSPKASAPGHLSLLWVMNGNSPSIVFWHLLRLYSNPALLEDIRREIGPFVRVHRASKEETGFPIQEPPRITIDVNGLLGSCNLLKASVFETLRLDSASLSFRELTADLTITETGEEVVLAGLSQPRSYQLKKGERVAVSQKILQNEPQNYSNPSQFDPLRFIQTDPKTGKQVAAMQAMYPFGGGMSMCKGRAFADRQLLAFSAAIVSLWDIQPATGNNFNLPKHKISSAAYLPAKDIRVRITERVG